MRWWTKSPSSTGKTRNSKAMFSGGSVFGYCYISSGRGGRVLRNIHCYNPTKLTLFSTRRTSRRAARADLRKASKSKNYCMIFVWYIKMLHVYLHSKHRSLNRFPRVLMGVLVGTPRTVYWISKTKSGSCFSPFYKR